MDLKNVLIFGDSYSTFKGYIPEGYAVYYSENYREETDVRNVAETWWHQLFSEIKSGLILNNSWSGSTICYTGYNNTDCSETSSFICRLDKLIKTRINIYIKIITTYTFVCKTKLLKTALFYDILSKIYKVAREGLSYGFKKCFDFRRQLLHF